MDWVREGATILIRKRQGTSWDCERLFFSIVDHYTNRGNLLTPVITVLFDGFVYLFNTCVKKLYPC